MGASGSTGGSCNDTSPPGISGPACRAGRRNTIVVTAVASSFDESSLRCVCLRAATCRRTESSGRNELRRRRAP